MARTKRTRWRRKAKQQLRSDQWYRGCDQRTENVRQIPSPIPAYYRTKEWKMLRKQILERDHHTCMYCGNKAIQADHIMPRRHGGADSHENLVASCAPCNRVAGSRIFKTFEEKKWWLLVRRKHFDPDLIPMTTVEA